ncbi:MAG: chromosomal replication initiator protein DnaA [Clostridiales bacterium]|nr:chromosomal replication initiator protein DnaA [Clostridiales bacterium]
MSDNTHLQALWKQILDKAKNTISPISFTHFFENRGIEPIDVRNRKIVLQISSESNAEALASNKIGEKLRDAIVKCDVGLNDFRLYVEGSDVFTLEEEGDALDNFQSSPIRKDFTFDSFVVGPTNKFVYAAAKAVAEEPGVAFNPLFIYGESGLGKTHLMHAIANYISYIAPQKRVLYTTCDNFLNEFVASITQKAGSKFRIHYRNVDVLMIDDIQQLKGKMQLQEELFNIFNELTAQNKQIVLTSDRPPKEIATLEDRLRTRFEGGMIADIQPPSIETKIAILQRKALDRRCVMPDDVLEFLAQNSGHDVRTLEGRLTKVIFASKLHEEPITLELAKQALNESVNEASEQEDVTPEKIISAVCTYFKQTREDLLGKGKKADLAKARQICAYLMCDMLSLPLDFIGKTLGGRDHTTIMYARDKMEKLEKLNDKVAKEIDDIKNIVLKK